MLVQVYCRTEIGSLRLNEASPTSGIGSGVSMLLKRSFLKFTTARKMAEGTAFAVTLVAFLLPVALRSQAVQAAPSAQTATAWITWGGVLHNSAGQPVAGATLLLTSETSVGQGGRLSATTQPDGSFGFPKVLPGRYSLVIQQPGKPATTAVTVSLPGPGIVLTLSEQNIVSVAPLPASSPAAQAATVPSAGTITKRVA